MTLTRPHRRESIIIKSEPDLSKQHRLRNSIVVEAGEEVWYAQVLRFFTSKHSLGEHKCAFVKWWTVRAAKHAVTHSAILVPEMTNRRVHNRLVPHYAVIDVESIADVACLRPTFAGNDTVLVNQWAK